MRSEGLRRGARSDSQERREPCELHGLPQVITGGRIGLPIPSAYFFDPFPEPPMTTATTTTTYEQLCEHAKKTGVFASINCLLGWDERTLLPTAAGEFRAEQMATLAGLVHSRCVDPRVGDWLNEVEASDEAADPASDVGATVANLRREYDKLTKLPQDLVERIARITVEGQQAWVEARKQDDFASFRPQLEQIVSLVCEKADALGHDGERYDALLDEYEPGAKTAQVADVLNELGAKLQPFVAEIVGSGRVAPVDILKRSFPVEAQREFGIMAASAIGFDFDRGRLDVTHHPFCESMGPSDVRITTRYDEHWFPGSFFGTMHEAGHGIYEQGLRADQFGLPLGKYSSLGVHESQSRLWENSVGRSRAFWHHLLPKAKAAFPTALADVSDDDFFWAINNVCPSLIRVEADEATYNLHIIIRFELERELVSERLAVKDLPAAWNEKYEHYLGITPPSNADGVLQDIHWSSAAIGYFSTYSLGNLYAAQLYDKADQDLGGLAAQFERGEFAPLRDWLLTNVHQQGQRYTASDLIERVCGQPLSSEPLMNYLGAKLRPLYGLA